MSDKTTTKYILSMPFDAEFVPILNELAMQIGLNESIVLIKISLLMRRSKNIRDGKYWVYKTLEELHEVMPYLGTETIRRTVVKLKDEGYILVGNYNQRKGDHTQWYALEPDKCSSLLGVFVNAITDSSESETQNEFRSHVRENANSETQNGATLPESLIPNTDTSYLVATGVAAVVLDAIPGQGEKETVVTMATVVDEPAPVVLSPVPPPEPNMPATPYRKIIEVALPTPVENEPDEQEEDRGEEKSRKLKQGKDEKAAISRVFGISPTAFGSVQCYRGMIFGTCKVTGMWHSCRLQPSATLAEMKDFEKYADGRAEDDNCTVPTSPPTIQRWFEDFREEQKPIVEKTHPALLQQQKVVLPGDPRRATSETSAAVW